jgi:transposase-like protein
VLDNDVRAMKKMVTYCKKDVILQEKVYQRMKEYTNHKTHIGVHGGGDKASCPECESENVSKRGIRVTAAGTKFYRLTCLDCGKWYQIAFSTFNKLIRTKENLIKWI